MSKELFTKYYKENSWHGKESVSGPGSDYEQTKYLIPELQSLLSKFNIKSIFDSPCGDFNWMKRVDLRNIEYTGADIVEPLIKNNIRKYQKKNINFVNFDVVNDEFPNVDLIIVRDCLVHLTNADAVKVLHSVKRSKSKYLLTTHFSWEAANNNNDIKTGQWRRLNLLQEPFNLPFPQHIIVEGNIQSHDRDKTMSLWRIEDLPNG